MTAPQRETVKLVTVPNTLAECQQYCEVLKAEVLRLRAAQREAGEAMRERCMAEVKRFRDCYPARKCCEWFAVDAVLSRLRAVLAAGAAPATHDCDETCRGCPKCYLRTGQTLCDKTCSHRAENYPDGENVSSLGQFVPADGVSHDD